jgi:WD40 repeat protein
MAASWSNDSARIATAGADGVVTIWDAASQQAAQTYTVGSDIPSQQNGVVFANPNTVVSISLSGTLNLFDTRESNTAKWRTLHGPTKAITASVLGGDKEKTFYAGSFDGSVKAFDLGGAEEELCHEVEGAGHTALVSAFTDGGNGKVWSAGWDDKVASIDGKAFA